MTRIWPSIVTSVLFALSFVAARVVRPELQPLTLTLLRYLIAAGFLALLVPVFGRAGLRVQRGDWPAMILLGLCGIVGYHYFFFLSIQYTKLANTAIINASSPVVTGVLAACVLRERLAGRRLLGIALASGGVLWLLFDQDPGRLGALSANRGNGLMLVAVCS